MRNSALPVETSEFSKWHDAEDGYVESGLCFGNRKVAENYKNCHFPLFPIPTLVSLIEWLVRCTELLALAEVATASPKKTVVVFGQDLADFLKSKPRGATGHFKRRRLNQTLIVEATQQIPIANAQLWSVEVRLFTFSFTITLTLNRLTNRKDRSIYKLSRVIPLSFHRSQPMSFFFGRCLSFPFHRFLS